MTSNPEECRFFARDHSGQPPLLQGARSIIRKSSFKKCRKAYLAKSRAISIARLLQELQENEIRKDANVQDRLALEIKTSLVAGKDSLSFYAKYLEANETGIGFKTLRTGFIYMLLQNMRRRRCAIIYGSIKEIVLKCKRSFLLRGLCSPMRLLQTELEVLSFDTASEESIRTSALLALGNMAGDICGMRSFTG